MYFILNFLFSTCNFSFNVYHLLLMENILWNYVFIIFFSKNLRNIFDLMIVNWISENYFYSSTNVWDAVMMPRQIWCHGIEPWIYGVCNLLGQIACDLFIRLLTICSLVDIPCSTLVGNEKKLFGIGCGQSCTAWSWLVDVELKGYNFR